MFRHFQPPRPTHVATASVATALRCREDEPLRNHQPPRPTPVATALRCRAPRNHANPAPQQPERRGPRRKSAEGGPKGDRSGSEGSQSGAATAPSLVATALRCRALLTLLAAIALGLAQASAYEIQVRNFNALGNGTTSPGVGVSSATAGPISNPLDPENPYPASIIPGSDPAEPKFFLPSATFGAPVSSGVPRYSLGEMISPPLTDSSENPVDPSYWRSKPLQPGETVLPARTGIGAQPLLPALAAGEYPRFYYSEHADKVFAVQAGQVTITWISKRPVTINGTTAYDFKTESFGVTSSANVPVRQMFWTEKSFNAPAVSVPSGIIQVAKPIYTSSFPATVATEYPSVGTVNPDYNAPSELRTLWFESVGGTPSLRAYNREGRIFVEYLGELVDGSTTKRRFIGADIVEVSQTAPIA